ncbi:MAG: metallophosphoesterase, partial [Spirochaetales bacterium]
MKELAHRFFSGLSGRVYLPEALRSGIIREGGTMLVHLSDTPWEIYGFVRKLLRRLQPRYVVHTGDLVDDIKLEYDPRKRDRWETRTRQLLSILESDHSRCVYVVPGNHDDPGLLEALSGRIRVVRAGTQEIGGRRF